MPAASTAACSSTTCRSSRRSQPFFATTVRAAAGLPPQPARSTESRSCGRSATRRSTDGRAHWWGALYGGQLAIDFALAHPTLVAGLMLIGPGLTGHQDSDQRRMRMEALAAAARRGGSALAALWLNDPHLCPHGFPTPIEQQVRDMLQDNAGLFVSPQPSVGAGPAVGRLGGLAARCQVFVGEYDDSDNLAIAHTLRETVEGATFDIVSRAGHFPMLERAGWLPQILTAFLTAQAT